MHEDDVITLEVCNPLSEGEYITQLRALLHHPHAHTLKDANPAKCVIISGDMTFDQSAALSVVSTLSNCTFNITFGSR